METATTTKTKWAIDAAHSEIGFKVKHLMFANVRGTFREYNGTIFTNGTDFTGAEIDLHINPASINTGDEKRDGHLKSADFFDAEKFKEIRFKSTGYEKAEGTLQGQLTMKGITQPVKLKAEFGGMVKDPWGNEKAVFSVSGKINRKDWGLNWNAALETGGVLVSEDVWIECEVQLIRA